MARRTPPRRVLFTVLIIVMALPFLHRFIPILTPTVLGKPMPKVTGIKTGGLQWDWLNPNEDWVTWFPGGLPRNQFPVKIVRARTSKITHPLIIPGVAAAGAFVFDPVPEGQVGLIQYVTSGMTKNVFNNTLSPNSRYQVAVVLNGTVILRDDSMSQHPGYKMPINMFFPTGSTPTVIVLGRNENAASVKVEQNVFWSVWPDPGQEFGTITQQIPFPTPAIQNQVAW